MIFGLRILPAADEDVDAAALFLAQDSLETALRFCDAVAATFVRIREHPFAYMRFPLENPRLEEIRKCAVEGFPSQLVFYRVEGDMVEIMRVLHAARDLPEVLRDM